MTFYNSVSYLQYTTGEGDKQSSLRLRHKMPSGGLQDFSINSVSSGRSVFDIFLCYQKESQWTTKVEPEAHKQTSEQH